jgi:GNAT superfamily N-acetyltransferase
MTSVQVVDVTDSGGNLIEPAWLERAEQTHRQLRPQLPRDYVTTMQRIFAQAGRMAVAVAVDAVVGVAVWRSYENTFSGRFLYVDDLVTDAGHRSFGVGQRLLAHCETIATQLGCATVVLDSGVQRAQAHKFYFREGYSISAYNFAKALGRGLKS